MNATNVVPLLRVNVKLDDVSPYRNAALHYDSAVQRCVRLLISSSAAVAQRDFSQAERDRHEAYEVARTLSRTLEESFEIAYGEPDEECPDCHDVIFACECPPTREEG